MNKKKALIRWVIVSSFILHHSSFLHADGGAFRSTQRLGDFRVSVFTAPTSLRTGTVDVSVLVQDWATGVVRTDVPVTISLDGPGQRLSMAATNEAATNKLFQAAKFQVTEPGKWRVEVILDDHSVQFDIDIAAGMPGSWDLGLWIAWPFGMVLLFGVHQWLVRRRIKSRPLSGARPAPMPERTRGSR